jgi:ribosome biogenesis GTPase
MPDLQAHASDCKFYNCSHLHEPGCGVISAMKSASGSNEISLKRYKIYSELHAELSQPDRY